MFDRIAMKAAIRDEDIDTVVLRHYLEQCTEGDEVYYRSTEYKNLTGVDIEIRGGQLRAKFSVNKQYYKKTKGELDNSRPMTMKKATDTIRDIMLSLCVTEDAAVVTSFEIGLTMKMSRPADEYIRMVEEGAGRTMWNDPNYPEMRQKVTERSKYYRKVLKMYDKTYEAREKGRTVDDNILRVETVYRRQGVSMTEFLSAAYQTRIANVFWVDWSEIRFFRELKAGPGVRLSQWAKAKELNVMGPTKYKDKYRRQWQNGEITKKQWETMREYADAWPEEKSKYREVISAEEDEYHEKLLRLFQIGIITAKK
jgi:hypothetical protein